MVDISNKTRSRIDLALTKRIADRFLREHKVGKKEISIVFVGDVVMRRLNKEYRKKDKTTDVLSFIGEDDFLGEIIISYQQIKRQSKLYKNSVRQELIFILTHGLLHLLGHEDETEKGRKKMEKLGEEFINRIKVH